MKSSFISLMAWLVALLLVALPVAAGIVVDENGNIVVQRGQVLHSSSGFDGDDEEDNEEDGRNDDSSEKESDGDEDDGEEKNNDKDEVDEDDDVTVEDEEDEQKIAISQVPAIILTAAENAVPGITFSEAKVEGVGSDAVYELEGTVDGWEYGVKVSAVGTILKVEKEDVDDEEDDEVRLPGGIRVRTRVNDGEASADVYQGGTKVHFEREGDSFRIKVEDETGRETEVGEDDVLMIDERVDRNQIRVRTFGDAVGQARNHVVVERLNTQALTDLPLSVDLATNELTVTTPAGERVVAVLPDQAVQNMLMMNVLDRVSGQELVGLVRRGGIEAFDHIIKLVEQDGAPIYIAQGVKNHRLFGLIPVTTDVTVSVSAETGEVVDTDQSFWDGIIDIFSTSV